jgi:cyanophycinase
MADTSEAERTPAAATMNYSCKMTRNRIFWLCILLPCLATALATTAQTSASYRYFRLGNQADAKAASQPGFALMGGGDDLDEAFRWLCKRSGGGDFLVLRAHGDDEYNSYIKDLCHLNSVATVIISDRAAAMDPFVEKAIRHASGLFIAGGDQANYINFWTGTPVEEALNDAIRRGVPIGGTSAGLAVLGEYVYTAQGDKPEDADLDSKTALADPFGPRIALAHEFLQIPILKGVITDTHFAKRNRMGRSLVFLARVNQQDSKLAATSTPRIHGIGVQERAAVLLEPDGKATVIGHGNVYFTRPTRFADTLESGKPLTFRTIEVQKVGPKHTFDLKTWQGEATHYTLTAEAGVVTSTQPGGGIY